MEITEVRIGIVEGRSFLKAFASVAFDGVFAIRNIKIIDDGCGRPPLVAMPATKITDECPECHCRNVLQANYCNRCGWEFEEDRIKRDDYGKPKLYEDVAFPINKDFRKKLVDAILFEYHRVKDAKCNGVQ